ncbi:hypothetical protein K0U83_25410, partial [bacterium]|nr:hypothetical protein [bacterium]
MTHATGFLLASRTGEIAVCDTDNGVFIPTLAGPLPNQAKKQLAAEIGIKPAKVAPLGKYRLRRGEIHMFVGLVDEGFEVPDGYYWLPAKEALTKIGAAVGLVAAMKIGRDAFERWKTNRAAV